MLGKIFRGLTYLIVILSALNIGVEGIFGKNLVSTVFGTADSTTRIIQIVVGVAGALSLIQLIGCCSVRSKKCCSKSCHSHCDK